MLLFPRAFHDKLPWPAFGSPKAVRKLAAKLRAAGIIAERKTYANLGHVGLVTSIAKPLRGKAPVLDDMVRFAHQYAD